MSKYANRVIPRLPPKQLILDYFLDERRRGLQRWLRLISHHPLISNDILLKIFLTEVSDQNSMQQALVDDPDEFLHHSENLPIIDYCEFTKCRDDMRIKLNQVVKIKLLMEKQAKREMSQSKDFEELTLTVDHFMDNSDDSGLTDFSENFLEISRESEKMSTNQQKAVTERLDMVIEVLTAHSDMCDRVDKAFNEKIFAGTSGFRNVIRSLSIDKAATKCQEEDQEKRKAFSLHCVLEETKFVQKYLKLLPSILLQFSHEEAKGFSNISDTFNKIVQNEIDKLN